MKVRLTVILIFLTPLLLSAQDVTWLGGTGNWNDPTQWDTGIVPAADQVVLIPESASDTVFIPAGITALARNLEIEVGSTLILPGATSELRIDGNRLENQGTVINHGTIDINSPGFFGSFSFGNFKGHTENFGLITASCEGGTGVRNYWESTFINHEGASIVVSRSGREGVSNSGTFTNDGSISCRNSGGFGLLSNTVYYDFANDSIYDAYFTNTSTIDLNRCEGSFANGIRNNSFFDNQGTINIDSAELGGIYNSRYNIDHPQSFKNSGSIHMESGLGYSSSGFPSTNVRGIENLFNGLFVNEASGTIYIDSLSKAGINPERTGIENYVNGTMINDGEIDIVYTKYGIRNSAVFTNNNRIRTDDIVWGHIENSGSSAEFINNGEVITHATFGFGTRISNFSGATLQNNGLLFARNQFGSYGIQNLENSTFTNTDSVVSSRGVLNKGVLRNEANGKLLLDSAGITVEGETARLENFGDIYSQSHYSSLQISEGGVFVNNGLVSFFDTNGFGAIWARNSGSTITNNGSLEIDGHKGGFAGIFLQDSVTVENNGLIQISNINASGINTIQSWFYNSGTININDSITQNGISIPSSVFENRTGGTINLDGIRLTALYVNGTFTNEEGATVNILRSGPFVWPSSIGAGIIVGSALANKGLINIGGTVAGPGIKFRSNSGILTNLPNGVINITQSDQSGIDIENGAFENQGRIVFEERIAENALIGPDTLINQPGATIDGIGFLDGEALANKGIISPGFSPGLFTITPSYDHTAATYEVEISGNNGPGVDGGHDQIIVQGPTALGGICNINLTDGFNPSIGSSFVIMTCNSCNGTFDEVNLDLDPSLWEMVYGTNDVAIAFINVVPQFTTSPILIATEDELYTYGLEATDLNPGDPLSITSADLPAWLTLTDGEDGTASLSGIPLNDDVGEVTVTITVTDGAGASDEQTFTITVNNTNDPPLFTSEPVTTAAEDILYSYSITAEDVDVGDVLTITGTTMPAWLELIDQGDGTATLEGTPDNNDVGAVDVVITVTDSEGVTTEQPFTIAVGNINDPPVFTSVPEATATQDITYNYNITAEDSDVGDALVITGTTLPDWLSLSDNGDGTATMAGTPENDDVGTVDVVITVTDSEDAATEQLFTIVVGNINDPPVFTSVPEATATQDMAYNYNVTAEDVDVGDMLSIVGLTLPDWIILSDNGDGTASLEGVPDNEDVGTVDVVITVTDSQGAATEQSFTITVENANDPPLFTSVPEVTATQDIDYSYNIAAEDTDVGDVLTITGAILPDWLSLTDNGDGTASLEGVPDNVNVGVVDVVITVTDSQGASADQSFTITVENVNDQPVFTSVPVPAATQDIAYNYNVTAEDVDVGDLVTMTGTTLPDWLTLSDNGDGTASLEGTPDSDDVGVVDVVITATDSEGASTQQSFSIAVGNVNAAPTDIVLSNQAVQENKSVGSLVGILSTIDPDANDTHVYSFSPNNTGDIDAFEIVDDRLLTAAVLFAAQQDSYTVRITATDAGGLTTEKLFEITIIESIEEPIFQTGLTPNNDGQNDTWRLDNCANCAVSVFNRWGVPVFTTDAYVEEWDGTDGQEDLPVGTYYFVVDYKNGQPPKKGAITIMR